MSQLGNRNWLQMKNVTECLRVFIFTYELIRLFCIKLKKIKTTRHLEVLKLAERKVSVIQGTLKHIFLK